METKKYTKTISNNKKGYFNYEIEDKYICGLRIKGSEIKSIRKGDCSIKESHCIFSNGEIYIKNMYVKKYEFASINNHEEVYDRKLLLNKGEIKKIQKKISEKGYSIVPLKVIMVGEWAKVEIGIGKGKKNFDKRNSLKEKDIKRNLERNGE